jgi:hypothetical protein
VRKSLLAAAVVGSLFVLYAAAGHWLAPRFVRDALISQASRLGLELRLGEVRANPFALSVALQDIEILTPDGRKLASARGAGVDLAWASLWRPAWIVQRAWLEQPTVEIALGPKAEPNWPLPEKPAAGGKPVALVVESLTVQQGAVHFVDRSREETVELNFQALGLEVRGLSMQAGELAHYELVARLAGGGTISSSGSLGLLPLTADLQLELADLGLAQAQRWLPQKAVKIASGALSARGRLRVQVKDKAPVAAYEGAVSVRDLRLDERDSGKLLLGWALAETKDVKLDFTPFGVDIGEIVMHAPQGRLIIERDGSVNVAKVFRRDDANESPKGLHATLRQLRIEKGSLEFADRSLDTPFATTILELTGEVTGLSTVHGDPARVRLDGRVAKYGSARIRGTVDLQQPRTLADVTAVFRNLDLAGFTPYSAKFAGYRIASGRLSAELRYRVRDGGLAGANKLTIESMQLGEKVQSASALDLPLDLVVALLSDSEGRINLDIPVRGNLNNPQFNFGGLIATAIGDVIGKIASAPFRALGGLFGGDDTDSDRVRFEPGSAALTPPQEETVAQIAKALGERPQLGIAVRAGYDPERDAAALRTLAARHPGHAAKGAQQPGALEALARARGETVRAALLKQGVDPSRVRLEASTAEPDGKDGVPTALSLVTRGSRGEASTGASGPGR